MGRYTDETTLDILLADAKACDIVKKYIGDAILHHPLIGMAKKVKVKTAMKYHSYADVDDETAKKIYDEIMALE